jgi:hypothetical protein
MIHRQGGAVFQVAGQAPQIGDALAAHTALGIVFILISAMALPAGVHPIHEPLLFEIHGIHTIFPADNPDRGKIGNGFRRGFDVRH